MNERLGIVRKSAPFVLSAAASVHCLGCAALLDYGSLDCNEDCGSDPASALFFFCPEGHFRNDEFSCQRYTECKNGEYQSEAPGIRSDRVCSAVTPVCPDGTFEADGPTAFSDRICRPLQECGDGYFESKAPEEDSDRLCQSVQACPSDYFEVQPATDTTDRVCQRIQDCEPGYFVAADADWDQDRKCKACPPGTFSETTNRSECSPYSTCEEGQAYWGEVSATEDRVCLSCQDPRVDCSDPFAGFDEKVRTFLMTNSAPGGVVAITYRGKLKYLRAFGHTDVSKDLQVVTNMRFRIAGSSCAITSVAIHRLVEEEKLSLQDKIWELLELAEPLDQKWKDITIDHLLQHTAGFSIRPNMAGEPQPDANGVADPMFDNIKLSEFFGFPGPALQQHIVEYELLHRMMQGAPDWYYYRSPGLSYEFSYFGYLLLSQVIDKRALEDGFTGYEDYVQQVVLEPMGITRMELGKTFPHQRPSDESGYYAGPTRTESVMAPTYEFGPRTSVYWPDGGFWLDGYVGAGAWIASAADLIRFLNATDGESSVPDFLQTESLEHMVAQAAYDTGSPVPGSSARGWLLDGSDWYQVGDFRGSGSLIRRTADGYNYAVLVNGTSVGIAPAFEAAIDTLIEAGTIAKAPDLPLSSLP